ncbi:MAG: nuclear transport factor 2 family protein [Deltaproteobacteria bacterium]|nr:nuclear transport factor 2 family protein [Deltaproteobacteria bacterium]
MNESKIKQEVWQIVQALNRAWAVEGRADELKNYFHKDMVAITCTDRERIEGGDACAAAWKAFADAAKIHYWKEISPKVQIYGSGKFAVATYYWEMSYQMNGQTVKADGRDMFALVNENGKWMIVADQFSPYPQH